MYRVILSLPLICWLCTGSVFAAEIVVTTFEDELNSDGDCSLREAVRSANTDTAVDACTSGELGNQDDLFLDFGTYTLTLPGRDEESALTGDLDLVNNLTITGRGAGRTTIDGNGLDRIFDLVSFSSAIINDLTIKGGVEIGSGGGGIRMGQGTGLILRRVALIGNSSTATGGAIHNLEGTLDLEDSLLAGNNSSGSGGGYFQSSQFAELRSKNSTISGNTATSSGKGGGIAIGNGNSTLNNLTITNNSTTGTADVGGLSVDGGTTTVSNTIVAGNADGGASSPAPNCAVAGAGTINSVGHNLIGDGTGCSFTLGTGDSAGSSANPIDPRLAALGDNGGPTATHDLNAGSPAIDAGSSATPDGLGGACEAADARGVSRPEDGGGGSICDIGAAEMVQLFRRTFKSKAKQDGFIVESGEDTSTGGKTVNNKALNVGDLKNNRQLLSILSFQTKSIPDGAVILGAELRIRRQRTVGADPTTTHGPLYVEIESPFFGTKPRLESADFGELTQDAAVGRCAPGSSGPVNRFDAALSQSSLTEIDVTNRTQFRLGFPLGDNDDGGSDQLIFKAGESAKGAPALRLVWYVPG